MKLRHLEIKDAELMLEWMHDSFVVSKLQTDFTTKTIDDCIAFIQSSCTNENLHLAIVDEEDTYMGTVSLKHITDSEAEFAITIRKIAMGKGYSIWAMDQMLQKAFDEYGLKAVYWCVAEDNLRALRFYDKHGFLRVPAKEINISGGYTREQIESYIWYQVISLS
ncbi:GNAT family N-acetyltransferase, partial [Butyrivibrio sp. VCD2006]|uniref:GNAT family N-acetyltransferase n=1 Tax=Butyrivibrio sp. VCD2006 TaxID=1280664 RepID=UPI00055C06D5